MTTNNENKDLRKIFSTLLIILMFPSLVLCYSGCSLFEKKHVERKLSKYDDSYIRKASIKYKVPCITTLTAAMAAAKGIAAYLEEKTNVKSLQDYHADIK